MWFFWLAFEVIVWRPVCKAAVWTFERFNRELWIEYTSDRSGNREVIS